VGAVRGAAAQYQRNRGGTVPAKPRRHSAREAAAAPYTAQAGSKGPPPSVTNTEGGAPVLYGIRVDVMEEQPKIAGAGLRWGQGGEGDCRRWYLQPRSLIQTISCTPPDSHCPGGGFATVPFLPPPPLRPVSTRRALGVVGYAGP
jgi:hypothetical protein